MDLKPSLYAAEGLYHNELLMRNSYEAQLCGLGPGKIRDTVERIYNDEIRHCQLFAEAIRAMGGKAEDHTAPMDKFGALAGRALREVLESDQVMEEKLEARYMESLGAAELAPELARVIRRVEPETHAHSELLKLLLSGLK